MSEAAIAEAPESTQAEPQVTQASGDADREEADALLEELTAPKGTEADGEAGTEGDGKVEPDEDEETRAVIEARAAELAEQREKDAETKRAADDEKAKRKAEADGVDQAFRGRAEAVRAFGEENGWDKAAVERLVATFEAHHAQAAPVTQRQMQRDLMSAAGLPEDYEWTDHATFVKDAVEAHKGEATKGMIPETKHKRDLADALLAQKRRFQRNPELLTAARGASDRQTGPGVSGLSIQTLRNASPEQYEQLKEKYGSEAISRVYMQAANQ